MTDISDFLETFPVEDRPAVALRLSECLLDSVRSFRTFAPIIGAEAAAVMASETMRMKFRAITAPKCPSSSAASSVTVNISEKPDPEAIQALLDSIPGIVSTDP